MKKLDELKEALAKEKGYETWTKCINDHPNCMVETLMDIVALRLYNVSSSAMNEGDKMHYDSLKDCCNNLLDAVDSGKVPKRQIMGLRILLPR